MIGMDMLLRSMGINAEELQASVAGMAATIIAMGERLERIETKLDLILAKDETALQIEAHNESENTNVRTY